MKGDEAKRLKELELENGRLKKLVAEQALDKQILHVLPFGAACGSATHLGFSHGVDSSERDLSFHVGLLRRVDKFSIGQRIETCWVLIGRPQPGAKNVNEAHTPRLNLDLETRHFFLRLSHKMRRRP